jgi:hypothetical protein
MTADNSVFPDSNANDMRVTQDLNSFGEIIYSVCTTFRIISKQIGSHDMKQTDSSIIIVRNVCMLTSASMIVYLFFTRS